MTAMMHFHGNRILRNSRRWTWVVSMFNFSSTGSCVIRSLIFESQQTGIGWLCPKWYRYMQAVKFFFGILNLHYRFTCQWLGSTLLIVVFYVLHFAKCFAYNHVSFIVVFHCSRREHLKFKKKYWDNAHEPPIAYWAGALDRGSVPGIGGLKETKNVSSPSTCESQYCGEPPWPRGSVLGLRPPGLEFRILCLEGSVISIISPSSGGSPGPV